MAEFLDEMVMETDLRNKLLLNVDRYWYLIPLLGIAVFTWLSRNHQVDDALIYLRYVRNVIEGNGLTYNPGEKFNGLTSPLHTYLMIATVWIVRNYQVAMIGLSAVCFAGAALVAGRILG